MHEFLPSGIDVIKILEQLLRFLSQVPEINLFAFEVRPNFLLTLEIFPYIHNGLVEIIRCIEDRLNFHLVVVKLVVQLPSSIFQELKDQLNFDLVEISNGLSSQH